MQRLRTPPGLPPRVPLGQVRQGCIASGDVVALVVQSRAGGAKEIPFQRTVVLEQELLD